MEWEDARIKEEIQKNRFFSTEHFKKKERTDFFTARKVISTFSALHFIAISAYLIIILIGYGEMFFYGFENVQQLPFNTFIDQRYSLFWIILFFNLCRILLYVSYQWRVQIESFGDFNYKLHSTLVVIYIFIDIAYLLILSFYLVTCNSSWLSINPCNDNRQRYCAAYGDGSPSLCKSQDFTGLPYYELNSNVYFSIDWYFSIGFLIADIVQYNLGQSYHLSFLRANNLLN